MVVLLALFYFSFPVILIFLTRKYAVFKKTGAVLPAYITGLILGNTGLLPEASKNYQDLLNEQPWASPGYIKELISHGQLAESDGLVNQIHFLQDSIMTVVIPLAIILLIFSMDIRKWIRMAGTTLLSLILALISILIMVFLGFYLFRNDIHDIWKVSGMLVGVYSGGTPNLASIQAALHVDPGIFILTHTYDMVLSAVCLLFLISAAPSLFRLVLPAFRPVPGGKTDKTAMAEARNGDDFKQLTKKENLKELAVAAGLSVVIFAIGGGLSTLAPKSMTMMVVILSITSLAIAASFIPSVNRIKVSYPLGMYLIIVFSLVVSSMGNLAYMFNIDFLHLFLYVALTIFGSLFLHVMFSALFRLDSDTVIITSTALILSPPFVPLAAAALKNKEIILSGIAVGVTGYAIGNYLGIFTGYFLRGLM